MSILYYDCFAGISGDMNLGALVDLGVDPAYLKKELRKLKTPGYEIRISEQQRKGITGTQVEVILTHEPVHRQQDHQHIGPRFIFAQAAPHHEHRNLHDIQKIIDGSGLSENVKTMSMRIFELIAQAESKIHGMPVEKVHFHEVGAIDSIVDIVGAAICIDYLKPDRIISSPVEMGGGFVKCAHGTFPVPAPAALEIMKGKPMKLGAVPFETATPTGVAILAALADEFMDAPAFTISKIGYGIGQRDTEIPNVLRVCLCETEASEPEQITSVMLECNIDDMSPERYGYVMEQLFAAGADDVFLQNILMKKSRPAVMVSVLCTQEKVAAMEHILFTETSTLGTRRHQVNKTMLARKTTHVDTPWGKVRIKTAYYQDQALKWKPEYEDCIAISRQEKISIDQVYEAIYQKTGNKGSMTT